MTQDHTAEFTKDGCYCRGLGPCSCGCAQGFQAFPGCTIGGHGAELQMKERKGKWDVLRLPVRSPPRRALGDQTVFRTPKELKACVLSRDYDLPVTGGGHWAVPGLPGMGLWCASTELGAELRWPGCQGREGITGVCADCELRAMAPLHCFRHSFALNTAMPLFIQTPE